MTNKRTIEPDEISRLKAQIREKDRLIADFKAYDEKRKAYIAELCQEIGELKSYIEEIEDSDDNLRKKVLNYHDRLSYLEGNERLANALSRFTEEEISNLKMNCRYKGKCEKLQKRVDILQRTISELVQQLEKLKRKQS